VTDNKVKEFRMKEENMKMNKKLEEEKKKKI